MHHGPCFSENKNIFTQIERDLDKLKNYTSLVNLEIRMEHILATIQKAVAPVSTKAPCHYDLTRDNTIYKKD